MHCSSWKREEKCCAGIPTFGMHFSVVTAVTCKANINLDSHVDKNTSEWKMSSRSNGSKLKKNFGEKEIKLHFFFPCLVTSRPFPSCTHFSEQDPHILGNFHKHQMFYRKESHRICKVEQTGNAIEWMQRAKMIEIVWIVRAATCSRQTNVQKYTHFAIASQNVMI